MRVRLLKAWPKLCIPVSVIFLQPQNMISMFCKKVIFFKVRPSFCTPLSSILHVVKSSLILLSESSLKPRSREKSSAFSMLQHPKFKLIFCTEARDFKLCMKSFIPFLKISLSLKKLSVRLFKEFRPLRSFRICLSPLFVILGQLFDEIRFGVYDPLDTQQLDPHKGCISQFFL